MCDVPVGEGLIFDGAAPQIERIRDEDEYSGLRVWLPALLGRTIVAIKLDTSKDGSIACASAEAC